VIVLLVAVLPVDGAGYYTTAIGLMALLSIASYYGIEEPIRRSAWLTARREPRRHPGTRRAAAGLLALSVAIGLVAAVRHTAAAAPTGASAAIRSPCLGAGALDPAHICSPDQLGNLLTPSVDQSPGDTGSAFTCWSDPYKAMRSCSYGSTAANARTIALVGDSHAAMLIPGLTQQLVANNWRLDTYVGWGCLWMVAADATGCTQAMTQIQSRLTSGPRYDIVLTTGARQKSAPDKALVAQQMATAWAPVAARGSQLVILSDNPGVSAAALTCLARIGFSVKKNSCATPRAQATSVVDPLIEAAHLLPGATLVDLSSFFCPTTICPAVIGHEVVYRDTVGHITATYSASLAPYLAAAIRAATK
jgi:hypothetical protein